jgi:hypothetical protein
LFERILSALVRNRSKVLCAVCVSVPLLIWALAVLNRPLAQLPDNPDELTLYSIDGPAMHVGDEERAKMQIQGEQIHGYPVLGKVVIQEDAKRREIISDIKHAMRFPEAEHKCFIPRHLIRAVKNGETIDAVICFECRGYSGYLEGRPLGWGKIAAWPQAKLDKILSDASVPLAKKLWPLPRKVELDVGIEQTQ